MNRDLLIARLLNAADKLLLHAVPLADWGGDRLPEKSYEDYPAGSDPAGDVYDFVISRSQRALETTYLIPTVLLNEVASVASGLSDAEYLEGIKPRSRYLAVRNLLDATGKFLVNAIFLSDWSGKRLPERSSQEYPGIDRAKDAIDWLALQSRGTACIVPAALLDGIASLVLDLNSTDPEK